MKNNTFTKFLPITMLMILLLLVAIALYTKQPVEEGISPEARLKINEFAKFNKTVHLLMQFYPKNPNTEERGILEEHGVKLLSPLRNKTWVVSFPASNAKEIIGLPFVKSVDIILPKNKLSSHILKEETPPYSVNEDGSFNLIVLFFEDVSIEEAVSTVKKHDGEVTNITEVNSSYVGVELEDPEFTYRYFHELGIRMHNQSLYDLASEDVVHYIGYIPPPAIPTQSTEP